MRTRTATAASPGPAPDAPSVAVVRPGACHRRRDVRTHAAPDAAGRRRGDRARPGSGRPAVGSDARGTCAQGFVAGAAASLPRSAPSPAGPELLETRFVVRLERAGRRPAGGRSPPPPRRPGRRPRRSGLRRRRQGDRQASHENVCTYLHVGTPMSLVRDRPLIIDRAAETRGIGPQPRGRSRPRPVTRPGADRQRRSAGRRQPRIHVRGRNRTAGFRAAGFQRWRSLLFVHWRSAAGGAAPPVPPPYRSTPSRAKRTWG